MGALQRPTRLAAVVVGVVALLLVALLATREPAADRKSTSNLIGKQAPGVGGAVLLGEPFDIGATDRWVVVNFFASWCVPCIQEHPELVAFAEDHAETGDARVISVVYSDDERDVRKFFAERGGSWTVFDSDQGRTALDWGVARVPESYLVAPTGIVVARFVSGVTQAELDSVIDQYATQPEAGADGSGSGPEGPAGSVTAPDGGVDVGRGAAPGDDDDGGSEGDGTSTGEDGSGGDDSGGDGSGESHGGAGSSEPEVGP